jgi:predicted AlkP superfamily pyrophosphatase or phosphodiesterase
LNIRTLARIIYVPFMRATPATTVARTTIAGVLAVLGLLACGREHGPAAPGAVPPPPPPPKVLLISIDGLRPDVLQAAGAANILALAGRGVFTWNAQTVYPSTTLPGHTSMLTGFEPSSHGIYFDDYKADFTLAVPTVFAYAKGAGLSTAMVVGKPKFEQLRVCGGVDSFTCGGPGDWEIAGEAAARLASGYDLTFVHLPSTDLTGHSRGWMSRAYIEQVKRTDDAVGRLLQAAPPETTILLTADHGGSGNSHGTRSRDDSTIPWIAAGPRITRRGALGRPVRTIDTAATVLYVLGLALRAEAPGTVVDEAF